jgi:predicted  nucleic acid-binding Zn-ribbon protein
VAIKQIKLAALQANINTLTQEISTANNQRNHLENKLNEEMNNDKMRQLRFDIGVIDTKTVNYINLRNKAIDEYNIEIKKIIN